MALGIVVVKRAEECCERSVGYAKCVAQVSTQRWSTQMRAPAVRITRAP